MSAVTRTLAGLKMVDYFPQPFSWQFQWSSWPGNINYAADFAKVKAMNGNAVNLRIDVTSFGYPTPSAQAMARFDIVVGCAIAAGLKVVITTFDNFSTTTDIAGSEAWLAAVLGRYANNPNIAFIHLRNEVDPTDATLMTWLKSLIPYARTLMGNIPISISKADSGGYASFESLPAALSPVVPDFWDWHWYPTSVDGLLYPMLQHVIASIKPNFLHIGETGCSTFSTYGAAINGIPASTTAMNAYQEFWIRVMAQACKELGLTFHVWMLYDVDPAGAPAEGHDYSYAFGLYTSTGVAKPAVATLTGIWGGGSISQSFNGTMEAGVDDGAGSFVPAIWRVSNTGGNTGTLLWDQSVAHSGSASMKFTATTGTPSIWTVPVSSHVTPGDTVAASCWAQGSASTGTNQIAIAFYDLSGTFLSQLSSAALAGGSPTWTQLTASGTVPANAVYARIFLKAGNNTGSVWFDDVSYTHNGVTVT